MKKTARLEVREDMRLKRTIDALSRKMEITSTDFLRMVIRNGAKFYSKKLGIPYLLPLDATYESVLGLVEGSSSSDHDNLEEIKKLEDKMKKLK
jgi:antitoxin component of RelBE/YafQ-DinJ toxin-antitoxin module